MRMRHVEGRTRANGKRRSGVPARRARGGLAALLQSSGAPTGEGPDTESDESLLRELATEERRPLCDAIWHASDVLRTRPVSDALREAVAARLGELSSHAFWEVRQEVAHALVHLRHEAVQPMLERLLGDGSSWVLAAARRTIERRSELARCDLLKDHHERLLQRDLAEVEARYDGRARKTALRVAEKYAEMMVRELCHEVNRGISSIDAAHERLDTALGRARIDPEACREQLAVARARVSLLVTTLDAVRELMRDAPAEFRGECLRDIVSEAATAGRSTSGARRSV